MDNASLGRIREIEEAVHTHAIQRQSYESQLHEIEHARDELADQDEAYRILGGIMVKTDPKRLLEELEERHASVTSRIGRLQAQEAELRKKMDALREELVKQDA